MSGIAKRAPDLLEIQVRKFKERLARISAVIAEPPASEGREFAIEPARLEQEIVVLLERSDISEELLRLSSHVEQMIAYLRDDEPPEAADSFCRRWLANKYDRSQVAGLADRAPCHRTQGRNREDAGAGAECRMRTFSC
jgi:hypothetical protein